MEVIHENFSDEYCSVNDSDESDEDLTEHDKNYIFEYIRSNQLRQSNNEGEEEDEKG